MKIERKLYASALAIMLILITFGSMLAVDRTITDTDDNISTFISNSNGNYWEATWDNIQVAIDDLGTNGGFVQLPIGNFTITSTINITEGSIVLEGIGTNNEVNKSTTFWVATDLPYGVINAHGTGVPWDFKRNIEIRNIRIAGDYDTYTAVGINLSYLKSPIVENVRFDDINGEAIWIQEVHESTIRNCFFDDCGNLTNTKPVIWITDAAPDFVSTIPRIEDCVFEPCYGTWVHMDDSDTAVARGIITGNYFEGSNPSVQEYGIRPGEHTIITENHFSGGINHSYIYMPTHYSRYTRIVDNHFKQGVNASGGTDYAMISMTGTHGVYIGGNHLLEGLNKAIYASGSTNNITITDNTLNHFGTYGIYIYSKNSKINDNTISNIDPDNDNNAAAIYLRQTQNTSVQDNIIYLAERGIVLHTGGVDYGALITGNIIQRITDAGYVINGHDSNDIVLNNPGYNYNSLHDDKIWNSNGKYWPVDGTADDVQIQLAIDDVGTYGKVEVGCNVSLSSELSIDENDYIDLDFTGHKVTLASDITFLNVTATIGASVRDAFVSCYSVQTKPVILLWTPHDATVADHWSDRVGFCSFENIDIQSSSSGAAQHNFTGIQMESNSAEARIFKNSFHDMKIWGSGCGINLSLQTNDEGYISGNYFDNIYIDRFISMVEFYVDPGIVGTPDGINHNKFNFFQGQASTYSVYGLKNVSGAQNTFSSLNIWDWSVASSPQYQIWMGIDGYETKISIDYMSTSTPSLLDEGTRNYIESRGQIINIVNQSSEPSVCKGGFVIWHDSDDGKIYLVADWNGTQKKIELT